jgi:hypothetical protein
MVRNHCEQNILDLTPCRRKWICSTGSSSSTSLSNWNSRSCSPGISGKKWPRSPYVAISRTSRQKASSSGIYHGNQREGTTSSNAMSHARSATVRRRRMEDLDSTPPRRHIWMENVKAHNSMSFDGDSQGIRLEDIEEVFLSDSLSIHKEIMMRKSSRRGFEG